MPATTPSGLFFEFHALYGDLYRIYSAGDDLRAKRWDHELFRYLQSPQDVSLGYEFLQRFAGYVGTDPPLSVIRLACQRYHAALRQAEQSLPFVE